MGMRMVTDYTLARVTPRPGPGQPEPARVEYDFVLAGHGRPLNNPGLLGESHSGSLEPRVSFRLTQDTATGEVTANAVQGSLEYEITRTFPDR
jgi:hypothetical protein